MLSQTMLTTKHRYDDSDLSQIKALTLDEALLQIRYLQMNREDGWQSRKQIAKKILAAWAFSHYKPAEAEAFLDQFAWLTTEAAHA